MSSRHKYRTHSASPLRIAANSNRIKNTSYYPRLFSTSSSHKHEFPSLRISVPARTSNTRDSAPTHLCLDSSCSSFVSYSKLAFTSHYFLFFLHSSPVNLKHEEKRRTLYHVSYSDRNCCTSSPYTSSLYPAFAPYPTLCLSYRISCSFLMCPSIFLLFLAAFLVLCLYQKYSFLRSHTRCS